jgi:hypothetical protein
MRIPGQQPNPCGLQELAKSSFYKIINIAMTTTVDAIYEHGKLLLPEPLLLPENARVRVTIESGPEHDLWIRLSEQSLTKAWANDADDVFNALLKQ